jgi:soluble lytic murein transglycosylase
MALLKKIIPLSLLLIIAACAGERTLPPAVPESALPRPSPRTARTIAAATGDPEQGLKSALEAYRSGDAGLALLLARKLVEQYPGTSWYKRSLFVMEKALIQMDRESEADAAMLRVTTDYPELADYAVFLLAEYHFSNARYGAAAALYQQVAERYPKSSLVARASYRRGMALLGDYAYGPAIEVFEKYLQDYPHSESAPDAGLGLARALIAEAQLEQAIRVYRDVWIQYSGAAVDQEIDQAFAELRGGGIEVPESTGDELYERGRNLYRLNQYDKAVEVFKKLLEKDPSLLNRSEVLFRIGVGLFNTGRRGESASVLEKMVRDYPADPRAPEALYWLGKSYSKLGDWDRGTKTFQKILERFPESEWADDALFLSGNISREANDMKKALLFYGRLVQEYPESKFADSAIWWKAWSYYQAGDYRRAEQTLQELIDRYPRSFLVKQARYWQGRIAEKKGEPARAAAFYNRVLKKSPYTYYGHRASERLARLAGGESVAAADVITDSMPGCGDGPCPDDPLSAFDADEGPPVWTDETKQVLRAQPAFRKTLELMQVDMNKEAAQELTLLQDRVPRKRGMLLGLSKAFFDLGDYYHSLALVLRNYERYLEGPAGGAAEDLWLLAYPQGYWASILSYSRMYGQDPYFVAAIIREESQFSPEALSPAGARGLMQVMPATGDWVAQLIKLRGFDRGKLFESDTGVNIGTWYISHLMKRFKGDPLLVAAAYNAGPEAVTGWMSRNGYNGERDAFVEMIPFTETRGYVKKVLRNYAEYKRIYGKAPGSADHGPQISGTGSGLRVDD